MNKRMFWFLRLLLVLWLVWVNPSLAKEIELENGDKIDAKVISEDEDKMVVEHPQLGEITIAKADLKKPEPPNPGLFGTRFMEGWSRRVGFGFSGASGNSDDASVNATFSFGHSAKTYRSAFSSQYFYSSQQGVANTNSFNASYLHDFLFGKSRFYLNAAVQYNFDEYQVWRNRIQAQLAPGYDIFRRDNFRLGAKLGFSVAYTTGSYVPPDPAIPSPGGVEQKETRPEGVVGLSGFWKPFSGHELNATVTYYPDLINGSVFRLNANAEYRIALAPIKGLSLVFNLDNQYDAGVNTSIPVPGSNTTPPRLQKKNNLKYGGNLDYAF